MLRLNPIHDANKLITKIIVLDAISPETKISAEVEKVVFTAPANASFGTFPIQGCGTVVSFTTEKRFVLICFEGVSDSEIRGCETPPLFFIIELNGKKSKILDKNPYYLKDLLE